MSHILQEVGAELKVSVLDPLTMEVWMAISSCDDYQEEDFHAITIFWTCQKLRQAPPLQ